MYTKLKDTLRCINGITGGAFVLVGGCVRDAQWGIVPKDYDAAMCLGPELSDAEAFSIIEDYAMRFRDMGAVVTVYMAYKQGFNLDTGEMLHPEKDRFTLAFYACLKVTMPNRDEYDILLSRLPSVVDLVASHDCNINRVYYDGHHASQEMPSTLEFAHNIRQERIDYMTAKFNNNRGI